MYLLALVPVLAVAFAFFLYKRKQRLKKFADADLVNRLGVDLPKHKYWIKFILYAVALAFLIVGAANPKVGSKMEEVKREGIDIIICLDLSRSMNATDVKPSRLDQAKLFISKFIEELGGDRIGLIIFAGNAYLQMPITTDYAASSLFLESVSSDIVPTQGTAIGDALNLSIESFDKESQTSRAVLVISDGENHEGEAVDGAEEAQENDIIVHTIGVGTLSGGPVPLFRNGRQHDFQRDKDGNIITSKMNPDMLREVADAGEGSFFMLNNANETADAVRKELAKLEKEEMDARVFTDYEDQFQYFLAIALSLLLIDWLISYKRNAWFKKLNLFDN